MGRVRLRSHSVPFWLESPVVHVAEVKNATPHRNEWGKQRGPAFQWTMCERGLTLKKNQGTYNIKKL